MCTFFSQKRLLLNILSFLPAIVLLCFIFVFSSQSGEESGSLSFEISLFLAKLFSPLLPATDANELLLTRAESIHLLVRKAAHITEFFLLTLSIYLPLSTCFQKKLSFSKRLLLCFFFSVFFSVSDEFHQTFIPGRSGNFTDVCIDAIGIILATLLLLLRHSKKKSV